MPRTKKKYNVKIDLGRNADGSRNRKWLRADTKQELEALRRAAIIEAEKIRNPSDILFGEYAQKWFEIYKSNKSISTQQMYEPGYPDQQSLCR